MMRMFDEQVSGLMTTTYDSRMHCPDVTRSEVISA